jgi:hypothetical protein
MLYYGSLKKLPKLSISLTSSIKADSGVRYGGSSKSTNKGPGRRDKQVQGASIDESPWSEKGKGSCHGLDKGP